MRQARRRVLASRSRRAPGRFAATVKASCTPSFTTRPSHSHRRLGIFVEGQLQCIGNPKELTSRYGSPPRRHCCAQALRRPPIASIPALTLLPALIHRAAPTGQGASSSSRSPRPRISPATSGGSSSRRSRRTRPRRTPWCARGAAPPGMPRGRSRPCGSRLTLRAACWRRAQGGTLQFDVPIGDTDLATVFRKARDGPPRASCNQKESSRVEPSFCPRAPRPPSAASV